MITIAAFLMYFFYLFFTTLAINAHASLVVFQFVPTLVACKCTKQEEEKGDKKNHIHSTIVKYITSIKMQ